MKTINIGLIGHKFMGRAHTHAYTDLPIFFDTDFTIIKHTLCSNEDSVFEVAKKWGFKQASKDWNEVINNPDIDVIDIAAPSAIHAEVAIAAAKAGKHVFCEKPLALSMQDAIEMTRAVKKAKVISGIGFNYRKVPALALAKKMIDDNLLGDLFHFRGVYQQDWAIDPSYPLVWRLQKKAAGYGTHGDMGAHVFDIARFLVGEISQVCSLQETFFTKRPLPAAADGLRATASDTYGEVDVDDASLNLIRFHNKKTVGYVEATRYGTGHRNQNRIEISGSKGSLIFDMEKMNEIEYYNVQDPEGFQGFRTIQVGETIHPYMSSWWPAGHLIGYGETFINQAFDFYSAISHNTDYHPNFEDGLICQEILDSSALSAKEKKWIKIKNLGDII